MLRCIRLGTNNANYVNSENRFTAVSAEGDKQILGRGGGETTAYNFAERNKVPVFCGIIGRKRVVICY